MIFLCLVQPQNTTATEYIRHIKFSQSSVHYFWLQSEFFILPFFGGVLHKNFFSLEIINFSEFDHRTKMLLPRWQIINL